MKRLSLVCLVLFFLEIYIDGQLLIAEDNTGRWNQSEFFDVSYAIPDSMIEGKDHMGVKFQSVKDNTAGGVFYVRLVKMKL